MKKDDERRAFIDSIEKRAIQNFYKTLDNAIKQMIEENLISADATVSDLLTIIKEKKEEYNRQWSTPPEKE